MTKLIDADRILEELREECGECYMTKEREMNCVECAIHIAEERIREAPAVEGAQVVVLCAACRHWGSGTKDGFGGFKKCCLDGAWHGPENYCASGEAKRP